MMTRIGAITLALVMVACQIASADTRHPLDALDADEISRAAAILRAGGHTDDETPILSLVLEAPDKSKVLAWNTADEILRRARAVVRKNRVNREFVIDLDSAQIVDMSIVAGPGQPPVVFDEIISAIEIAVSNEEMQVGLSKRGITNFEELFCAPRTVGNFGAPFEQSRRLVKVDCFDLSNNPKNVFAAPIEGLFAVIDLESKEVLEVRDLGVVPVTQISYSLASASQEKIRDINPVDVVALRGGNIHLDGWNVSWHNWRFHIRWDMRAGLIVSMVQYADSGKLRNVLYQGNVSEIYVPYQDSTEGWYYRNYMDEGDYGLGTTHSPLVPGADCPKNAIYRTPVMANPAGGADELTDRICLFEQPTGNATWRHYDILTGDLNARPNVEMVVRFIATVGNYDYVFDWVFDNKGQLTYRLGASGLNAVKGVESQNLDDKTAIADTEFGPLIAPGLAGIHHDHFFSIRLDVDIDGRANRFVRDKLIVRRQPSESKRKSIWQTVREVAQTDSNAKFRLSFANPSLWRVESATHKNYLGYATSFALITGANARPLVDEDDPPLERAQFVNHHLWVTPYRDDELWSGGHYSNQSAAGKGLPEWTSENRNIKDTDIVLWYTLGFHHVPSTEDWPVYSLGSHSITLRPYNFFDQNPAMDLPEVEGED